MDGVVLENSTTPKEASNAVKQIVAENVFDHPYDQTVPQSPIEE